MAKIIFISGACGCGKSTFADAYAKYLNAGLARTPAIQNIQRQDNRSGI